LDDLFSLPTSHNSWSVGADFEEFGGHSTGPAVYCDFLDNFDFENFASLPIDALTPDEALFQCSQISQERQSLSSNNTSGLQNPDLTPSMTTSDDELESPATPGTAMSSNLTAPSPPSTTIDCTWPTCNKCFPDRNAYNHHFLSHSLPFTCLHCPARHSTKRHRDRHINDKHIRSEKYYCSVIGCKHSMAAGRRSYARIDNCRRHMRQTHGFSEIQARECDMDEETREIVRIRGLRFQGGG